MKIYTGSGDRGMTSLFSGERVAKSHIRVEAYGDMDELNSFLGALAAAWPKEHSKILREIQRIQSELLHIGTWLATTPESSAISELEEITPQSYGALESAIDRMQEELSAVKGFIIPGGHITAAWAHIARTVCRRVERHMVRLLDQQDSGEIAKNYRQALVYLNRLSDYLFVLARYANRMAGVSDVLWKK